MPKGSKNNDIEQLNSTAVKIVGEDNLDRRVEIAEQILKDVPRSPMARYVKWQAMDDEDPAVNILALSEIVNDARAIIAGLLDELNDEARLLYSTMLSDLASCLYFGGKKDEALDIAKEFMDADIDGNTLG
ncbi:MAG: hypothetical protein LBT08_10965, partial [Synergistaceae bacterium]|nr:hypothetical protein [Synergistaceae bacterium]